MRVPILLGLVLAFTAPLAAGAPDPIPPRFAIQATFEATPEATGNARFRLRGTLEPRASRAALLGVGFVLKASLSPKTGPICHGPGHIFADGFESP